MTLLINQTNCGCGYMELVRDEKSYILYGDSYHDKIDIRIDSYLKALADNDIKFSLTKKIIKCPHDCED
jgi:hypothetical protein